jgi:hypothetical protein
MKSPMYGGFPVAVSVLPEGNQPLFFGHLLGGIHRLSFPQIAAVFSKTSD